MTTGLLRASAFAGLMIVLAGYILIYRPLETAAADRYVQLDAARATLEQRLDRTKRIPSLERERVVLDRQLRSLHAGDRRAATVDRFLRAVSRVAARSGVTVENVAGDVRQSVMANARATPAPPVEELPLDLTLRGRYGDVIRAVRDLDGGDVAARITLGSLGSADRRTGISPRLNAAFHITLLRESDDVPIAPVHPL